MELFKFIEPTHKPVPILISVPHSGTYIPEELREHFLPEQLDSLEDTDWFVDRLYDFAPSMGISMIVANYHRWVIDLNRHPFDKPMYDDGRTITELCPTSTFNEDQLYYDHHMPQAEEIERRVTNFYKPYYEKIRETLSGFKEKFGMGLLWDAHSIKQHVPGIRNEIFPDLILGDNDESSAPRRLIQAVLSDLESSRYKVSHNDPFKGGNITRYFGKPDVNHYALQLEMTKINYMGNDEVHYNEERAGHVRNLLQKVFISLIEKLPHEGV